MAITVGQLQKGDVARQFCATVPVRQVAASATYSTVQARTATWSKGKLVRVQVAKRNRTVASTGTVKLDVYYSTASVLSSVLTLGTSATVDVSTSISDLTKVWERDTAFSVRVKTLAGCTLSEATVHLVFEHVVDRPLGA